MNNLIRLIGPAPSELPYGEFLEKLLNERQRVVNSLIAFRAQPPQAKGRKAKAATKKRTTLNQKAETMKALEDKALEMGISVEEMMKLLTAK